MVLNDFESTMILMDRAREQLAEIAANVERIFDDYMQTYIQNVALTRQNSDFNQALHRQANKMKSLGQTVHDLELKQMERNREMKLPPEIKEHRDENGKTTLIVDVPVQNKLTGIEPRWFDVNERLPETEKEFLVWYEYYRYGEANCMYQTYGIAKYLPQKKLWSGDVFGAAVKVLFWTPLPIPPVQKECEEK